MTKAVPVTHVHGAVGVSGRHTMTVGEERRVSLLLTQQVERNVRTQTAAQQKQ